MTISSIQRIAIIVAMEGEAQPIVENLKMSRVKPEAFGLNSQLDLTLFEADKRVFLILNGKDLRHQVDRVGTQPAVLTTYAAIVALKPDLIISAGTAGGLKESQIGDVYLSNSHFVFCDRIINLPKFKEYGTGHFNYLSIPSVAEGLGLKLGTVATSNSLDPTLRDLEELKRLDADVVDMEAAAIAEVAQRLDVKMVALKSVTNFLDKELHSAFLDNYSLAVANLAQKVAALIPQLLA